MFLLIHVFLTSRQIILFIFAGFLSFRGAPTTKAERRATTARPLSEKGFLRARWSYEWRKLLADYV